MLIKSDTGACQGYGNCVDLAPAHFDLDDDGLVVLLQEAVADDVRETVTAAVRSCPVQAIWLGDDDA
ncbi:MAG: ferredoxin [Blastococcus sp.]|jgi:ferredoxin|nr:ferredoxin [Blastococcus sp.]